MRHALVRALVVHFLERSGYVGKVRVFTRRETFDRAARGRHTAPLSEREQGFDGLTVHGRIPLVWINAEKHTSVAQLTDTSAHEAAHIVLGHEFPHGRAFDRRVRRLLRGGVL